MTSGVLTIGVIVRRDLIRMLRQPARIAAAVGTPLLLWIFLSSGFAESFASGRFEDASYAAFMLPGGMTLVAMFAAIFASISIIEERNEGWLQGVLIAPVPRWSIALGKMASAALQGWIQAMVLLPAALALEIELSFGSIVLVAFAVALTSIALAGLGLIFAWRCDSAAEYHAVMNLVLMPLWLVSGALFPVAESAPWLRTIATVNPLTWCTDSIRNPMLGEAWFAPMALCAAFAALMALLATAVIGRGR